MKSITPADWVLTLEMTKHEDRLYSILSQLPKHRLVLINATINKVRTAKFHDKSVKKYGDLPRGLSEPQLRLFFQKIHTNEMRKIFLIQFFYALRIGEINSIEVLREQNILRIWNEKCDRWDHIPIHGRTIELFDEPIKEYRTDYLRKIFNNTIKRAGLEYIYHTDTNGYKHRQFTTHTIRHSGITVFLDYVINPIKAMRFSRHRNDKSYGSLPIYMSYPHEKLRADLETAFRPYYDLIE